MKSEMLWSTPNSRLCSLKAPMVGTVVVCGVDHRRDGDPMEVCLRSCIEDSYCKH